MKSNRFLCQVLWTLVCSLFITGCEASNSQQQPLAITHVSVIPMDQEGVLDDQTVLISQGIITHIGSSDSVELPPEALEVDGRGKYLLPGFSDMHAHVRRKDGHREKDYLEQGITTVRNMQGESAHLKFRRRSEPGGAVFRTAGQALAGLQIDRRHRIVETEEDGRAAVREQVEAGYDYIKVYSFLKVEVYDAILDEAGKLGIPVIGHVSDDVKARRAIASGLSSIEHLYGYFWDLESSSSDIVGEWKPRRLFHAVEIDPSLLPVLARLTAEAGVWNCPTLWRKANYLTSPLAQEAWDTPSLRELGHTNRMRLVHALHEAGAGLLAGTDDRAEIIHEELALFVEAGLTPFEALKTTTVNAAEFLGLSGELGTVSLGKRANLVLLGENPLQDIRNTTAIVGVVVGGAWIASR